MIEYNHGYWGIKFMFAVRGSVFPKALAWAIPAAGIATFMNILKVRSNQQVSDSPSSVLVAFNSFITVLGFMVVFRSNQGWSRFWEGASLVQTVRGEWFNAVSSMFAFCTRKPEKRESVERFQRLVVRLMSLLYACALSSLTGEPDFPIIDQEGMDELHISFVNTCCDSCNGDVKCEVILQWLQRTVVDNIDDGVLTVAPPVVSRVFQELSRGVVNIVAARKINELPFPFPSAQLLSFMLVAYTFGVPCAAGYVMDTWWGAAGSTFANVFVLWGVNYLAAELEHPFGAGNNNLPLEQEMNRMNALLKMLLHTEANTPPVYAERRPSVEETTRLLEGSVKDWKLGKSRGRASLMVGAAPNDPPGFRVSWDTEGSGKERRLSEIRSSVRSSSNKVHSLESTDDVDTIIRGALADESLGAASGAESRPGPREAQPTIIANRRSRDLLGLPQFNATTDQSGASPRAGQPRQLALQVGRSRSPVAGRSPLPGPPSSRQPEGGLPQASGERSPGRTQASGGAAPSQGRSGPKAQRRPSVSETGDDALHEALAALEAPPVRPFGQGGPASRPGTQESAFSSSNALTNPQLKVGGGLQRGRQKPVHAVRTEKSTETLL